MNKTGKASIESLKQSTLDHYERLSAAYHVWDNQVPQAIEFWYDWKTMNLLQKFLFILRSNR